MMIYNTSTRLMWGRGVKLASKKPCRSHNHSSVFIVDDELLFRVNRVFLLLTLTCICQIVRFHGILFRYPEK